MKVASYARVSTVKQVADGASVDIQQEHIRRYAGLYDLTIVDEFIDDGYSGKNLNRPGIKRVLAGLHDEQYEGVVIYDLSRLTRSVRDMATLLDGLFSTKGGRHLFSTTEQISTTTAAGVLFITMTSAFHQYFRMQVGEKVKDSVTRRRKNGQRTSNVPPFGFELDCDGTTLIQCDREQATIQRALELRALGASFRDIGKILDDEGMKPRNGGSWAVTPLRRILLRNANQR